MVAGCVLFPNTVRGAPEQCGLSLLWRHQSRRLAWFRCVATFASRKPGGPINRKNGLGQRRNPSHFLVGLRIYFKEIAPNVIHLPYIMLEVH